MQSLLLIISYLLFYLVHHCSLISFAIRLLYFTPVISNYEYQFRWCDGNARKALKHISITFSTDLCKSLSASDDTISLRPLCAKKCDDTKLHVTSFQYFKQTLSMLVLRLLEHVMDSHNRLFAFQQPVLQFRPPLSLIRHYYGYSEAFSKRRSSCFRPQHPLNTKKDLHWKTFGTRQ